MKKVIRLTESDLHNIVKKAVKKVLNENNNMFISNPSAPKFYRVEINHQVGFDENNPDFETLEFAYFDDPNKAKNWRDKKKKEYQEKIIFGDMWEADNEEDFDLSQDSMDYLEWSWC